MKFFKKKSFTFLMTILMMFTLVACGGDKKETASTSTNENGELVVGVTSFADTLEPTEQYFSWVITRYGVGENLVRFDENGELEPSLAEEWKVSDDKLTWEFKIRDGVKFSNGNPLTAEAVKSSLDRTFRKSKRALFLIIDTSDNVEEYTTNAPICTGPYVFKEFVPTEYAIVERNENYWGGKPGLAKVTFKCINDQSTRALSLKSGEIGVAYNLKIENKADFEGQDDINIQELKSLRSTYAFMNQHGALGDLALRQALLRALDKKAYTENLLGGAATPGKAPIPPTLDFGFDKLVDENAYNPESSKEILAKAGYKDVDGDGFVEKPDGSKLELNFVIYTSREELKVYAQAAQANLKDVGININLKTVSYETLLDMRDSGNFDLLIWNVLAANTGDPEKYLYENWDSRSASNQAGYKNEKVDELLDKLNVEFDPEKRKDLAIEIQQLIMNDAATVFFGYETTFLYSNKKVQNLKMFPMDYYWLTKDVTVTE